jgi:WD40 repeat protein
LKPVLAIQLGDWFHAQSPSLALLNLADSQAIAYELTGPGMSRYAGMRGVGFDIDEHTKQIAILCVDADNQLQLGLGEAVFNDRVNRFTVNISRSLSIGKLKGQLNIDHDKPVAGLSFCGSGEYVVLSYDASTVLIEVSTGKVYPTKLNGQRFVAASGSPQILVQYERSCLVWMITKGNAENEISLMATSFGFDCVTDLKTPATGSTTGANHSIESLEISEDGRIIVIATSGGLIGYRTLESRDTWLTDITNPASSLQLLRSNERVLFGTRDRRLGEWNLKSGKVNWIDNSQDVLRNPIIRMNIAPDSTRIYSTDYQSRVVVIYKLESGIFARERVISLERGDLRSLRAEFFSRRSSIH